MKRVLLSILLLVFYLFSLPGALRASGPRLTFLVQGNYFNSADDGFKKLYGGKKFFPEGKVSLFIVGNLYLWGSYGAFPSDYSWIQWSNKGVLEADLNGKNVLEKRILSGGVGFFAGYMEKSDFAIKAEVGLCSITNAIEATLTYMADNGHFSSARSKQSGVGFRANLGFTYGLLDNVFSEFSFSYILARDKIDESTTIDLGGLQMSVGLGIRL